MPHFIDIIKFVPEMGVHAHYRTHQRLGLGNELFIRMEDKNDKFLFIHLVINLLGDAIRFIYMDGTRTILI